MPFYMYVTQIINNCKNLIKRQVFPKAKNVHNKQADILQKATTPTLLSCILVIYSYIPFKKLLITFVPQFGTGDLIGLIDYLKALNNKFITTKSYFWWLLVMGHHVLLPAPSIKD